MRNALHHVLITIAASGAHRHFGVCQDCAYLGGEMYCDLTSASRSALGCQLFGVPIEPDDAGLLCVHFQPNGRAPRGRTSRMSSPLQLLKGRVVDLRRRLRGSQLPTFALGNFDGAPSLSGSDQQTEHQLQDSAFVKCVRMILRRRRRRLVGRLHPRLELRPHVLRHFGTASCGGKLAGKWHGSASLLTTAVTRNGVWLASWTTSRPALRTCASRCRRRATRTTNLLERLSVEERFREALTFVQEIGELAEAGRHHPNISFGWGNATVSLQPRRSRDCMRTTSSWPPRSTPYSLARPRGERVLHVLQQAGPCQARGDQPNPTRTVLQMW